MNTGEKYNTTATIIVNVLDGDDQYPIFLPCTPISQDQADSICTNPLYTVNITEKEQVRFTIMSQMCYHHIASKFIIGKFHT